MHHIGDVYGVCGSHISCQYNCRTTDLKTGNAAVLHFALAPMGEKGASGPSVVLLDLSKDYKPYNNIMAFWGHT